MHHVCGLCFCLCFVCVPPFSEEGDDVVCKCGGFMDVCRDILNSCVVVVVECVRACQCVRMSNTECAVVTRSLV